MTRHTAEHASGSPGSDTRFTRSFDAALQSNGVRVRRLQPMSPNLNAFVERWIQSLKHEALNAFVVFGLAHFDHIVREFVDYYNHASYCHTSLCA